MIGTREDPLDAPRLYAEGKARGALVTILDVEFPTWAARWPDALGDTDGLLARIGQDDHASVRAHIVEVVRNGCPSGGSPPDEHRRDETPREDGPVGPVHLVGAGPGDPELLTVRAARLLTEADLIVHDQLVPASILALADPRAELIPVGRRLGHVVLAQDEVIDLLAEAARRGRRVVRLKGGDPVVFGRGAEEALELAERGLASELVPGISSAIAAPELAGIPLTSRGVAAGFLVVTARSAAGSVDRPDWDLAAQFTGTLVVLMGATRVEEIAGQLIDRGRPRCTPAAIVERAGLPEQRVVTGDLGDLPARAHAAGTGTPAVIVIGDVVAIRGAVERARATADHARDRAVQVAPRGSLAVQD